MVKSNAFTGGAVESITVTDGIYLGGAGAENLLADYETGVWTPSTATSNGLTGTWATTLTGRYTKIGRVVTAECIITGTAMVMSLTGYVQLLGLPFPCNSVVDGVGAWRGVTGVAAGVSGAAYVAKNETFLWMYATRNTNASDTIVLSVTYTT